MKIVEQKQLRLELSSEEEFALRKVAKLFEEMGKKDTNCTLFDDISCGAVVEIDCFGTLADFLREEILSRC